MMPRRVAGLDPDLLLQVFVGAALGISCVYASGRHRLSMSAMLIPRLVIGYLLAALADEAGHAAEAVLQNFRISAFAVWPVRFYRDSSLWRVGWLPRKGSKGFISITPIGVERLRMRWFIVVAAGPLASALVGVGCWIAITAKGGLPNWALDQLLIIT